MKKWTNSYANKISTFNPDARIEFGRNSVEDKNFYQEDWAYDFGDYQRFVIDAYEAKVHITKTEDYYFISLNSWNKHNGQMVLQEFWKFDLKEEKEARDLFDKIKNKAIEIFKQMTRGEDRHAPTLLIHTRLRDECWDIDRKHLAKSNIPCVNYAREKLTYEGDWRKNIYGPRYPKKSTSGF